MIPLKNSSTFVILPFSNSCAYEKNYWQDWPLFIDLLFNNCYKNYNFLICGQSNAYGKFNLKKIKNSHSVINLLDKTQNIIYLYSIAEKVKKIYTTHNGMAVFSRTNNLNCAIFYSDQLSDKWKETFISNKTQIINIEDRIEDILKMGI